MSQKCFYFNTKIFSVNGQKVYIRILQLSAKSSLIIIFMA